MIAKVSAVLFAATGVLCAWTATYIPAAVFAVLYLIFFFIPLKQFEMRFILLSASGLPLVLSAGHPVSAGIVSFLLLLSLLGVSECLDRKTAIFAVLFGALAGLCAFQSSAAVAVLLAAVFALIGIYVLFITEYRIRKKLKVNPHERV